MKTRQIAVICALFLCVLLFASCGKRGAEGQTTDAPSTTLTTSDPTRQGTTKQPTAKASTTKKQQTSTKRKTASTTKSKRYNDDIPSLENIPSFTFDPIDNLFR